MGVVYAAWDPLIGRTVAVKTIPLSAVQAGQSRDDMRQRLRREAQSAGVLSHPGIITIYDIGEEGEEAYIVMEFVDGLTMEEVFSTGSPQHRKTLLMVLNKAAAALDYAHSKGVIHRDVKPSNIMISSEGTVKVADFGVAKISASTALTQSGFVVGTPNYMSPEQAQGRPIDGRSDQFSLAVVAYRMLTGKLPFDGPTLTAVLSKILWEEPEYETTNLGPQIQAVFTQALSKDPAHRFPNCSDFVRDLEQASECEKAELSGRLEERMTRPSDARGNADVPPLEDTGSRHGAREGPAGNRSFPPGTVPAEVTATTLGEAPAQVRMRSTSGSQPAAAPISGDYDISGVCGALPADQPDSGIAARDLDSTSSLETDKQRTVAPTAEPAAVSEAPARKTVSRVWIAAGGLLLMLVVVIAVIRILGRRESVPLVSAPQTPSAAQTSGVAAIPAVPEIANQVVKPARKPSAATPAAKQANSPNKISAPGSGAGKAAPTKNAPGNVMPISGILTWTGSMGKNTILVISPNGASFGVVTGQLPGVPVTIEVEPKDLEVRQAPAQDNSWSLIILSSRNQKYNSITIRWTVNK